MIAPKRHFDINWPLGDPENLASFSGPLWDKTHCRGGWAGNPLILFRSTLEGKSIHCWVGRKTLLPLPVHFERRINSLIGGPENLNFLFRSTLGGRLIHCWVGRTTLLPLPVHFGRNVNSVLLSENTLYPLRVHLIEKENNLMLGGLDT